MNVLFTSMVSMESFEAKPIYADLLRVVAGDVTKVVSWWKTNDLVERVKLL